MVPLADHRGLVDFLRTALRGPLPGAEAHRLMAPRPRRGWIPGVVPTGARPAAALLLLFPRAGQTRLLLTVRQAALPAHAGQVSLPGGAVDAGESIEQAALREAEEEVGAERAAIELLGRLTPLHVPVSGFGLVPVVATAEAPQRWRPQPAEVAEIHEIPLAALAAPGVARVERWRRRGAPARVPCFRFGGLEIWGATAMVLAELLALLGRPPRPVLS